MKKAVLEYNLNCETIHLRGYLVKDDYFIVIENNIMWMYNVQMKDSNKVYVSNSIGLSLGKLGSQEVNKQTLILRVFDFMQNLSFYDFLRYHHDWTMDYNFQFVEAVS